MLDLIKRAAELVPGGKGRNRPDSDFDPEQLRKAELIEKEHFVGSGITGKKLKKLEHEIGKDHLTEKENYYDQKPFEDEIKKEAGGPGSGVVGDNTLPIGLPQSKHVSVGTRQGLLDNMPYYETTVPMSEITAVAQEKYVPKKLNKMMDIPGILNKPIDVLKISDKEYHVIDGHHRYLVARHKHVKTVPARVYEKRAE